MRLDAQNGDTGWQCYDAKHCRMVPHVVWVDDETATWGCMTGATTPFDWIIETVQEDRISIYPSRRLVIFNEIDDKQTSELKASMPVLLVELT
jgi:hypothetical protein